MTTNIFEKGCLIHLTVSIFTGRVKLPKSAIHVDADPAFINATKFLIEKDCIKPIEVIRNEARHYIYGKTLQFPVPGVVFIPKDLITEVDARLRGYQQKFDEAVDNFVLNYDTFIAHAKVKLNGLFNPMEYPADIRKSFGFNWRFFVMDAPGHANLLSAEIYEAEREKFITTINEFEQTAINTLRASFAEMVDHMVERLSDGGKVFRNSLVSNIKEFMADFKALNITDDTELENLITRCKTVLGSADPDSLRNNDKFRAAVANGMAQIQGQLDTMMVDRPTRKLRRVDNAA